MFRVMRLPVSPGTRVGERLAAGTESHPANRSRRQTARPAYADGHRPGLRRLFRARARREDRCADLADPHLWRLSRPSSPMREASASPIETFQRSSPRSPMPSSTSARRRVFILDTGVSTIAPVDAAIHASRHPSHDPPRETSFAGPRFSGTAHSLKQQPYGSHADEIETSLMLVIAPQLVDMTRARASPFSAAGPSAGPPFTRRLSVRRITRQAEASATPRSRRLTRGRACLQLSSKILTGRSDSETGRLSDEGPAPDDFSDRAVQRIGQERQDRAVLQRIMEDLKPEAVYFTEQDGKRSGCS